LTSIFCALRRLENVTLINGRNYDAYYVTAENKKYFVLRDAEKNAQTPQADGFGSPSVKPAKSGPWGTLTSHWKGGRIAAPMRSIGERSGLATPLNH
jgi:hypothetical protein